MSRRNDAGVRARAHEANQLTSRARRRGRDTGAGGRPLPLPAP